MRGVTGVYDMTPDSRRCWGRFPASRDSISARIFGHGLQDFAGHRAGYVGTNSRRCAATVDISAFRPTRFAERKPIKAEFEYKDD